MSDMYEQPARPQGSGATSTPAGDTPAADATTGPDAAHRYVPRQTSGYDDVAAADNESSDAAYGLTLMAAAIMMVAGVLGFFEGLALILKGTFFVVLPNYSFSLSTTGWGTIHMVIGAVVFLVGAALLSGNVFARILGVIIAACSAIANFVFLPYYPVWAIVVIALDIFVIWALLTPRNPMTRARRET